MDINQKKDCEMKLLDDELNEITGGNLEDLKKAGCQVAMYAVKVTLPKEVTEKIRSKDNIGEIRDILKDWKEKWEKRKEEKDKLKNSGINNILPPQE